MRWAANIFYKTKYRPRALVRLSCSDDNNPDITDLPWKKSRATMYLLSELHLGFVAYLSDHKGLMKWVGIVGVNYDKAWLEHEHRVFRTSDLLTIEYSLVKVRRPIANKPFFRSWFLHLLFWFKCVYFHKTCM